jgi:hypothetical protein
VATHADPQEPLPYASDHFVLDGIDDVAIALWVTNAGPESASTLAVAELRQLGGAFSERPADGGAFDHIAGQLSVFNIGVLVSSEAGAVVSGEFLAVRNGLAAYTTGFSAPTMVENPGSPRRTFPQDVESRIAQVRSRVDPTGIFTLDARLSL